MKTGRGVAGKNSNSGSGEGNAAAEAGITRF
jgi:hypothetical protein